MNTVAELRWIRIILNFKSLKANLLGSKKKNTDVKRPALIVKSKKYFWKKAT